MGSKELDTTEWLNWTELILTLTAPIILNWESWCLEPEATKILKLQRQVLLCSLFYTYYGRKIAQRMFNILQQEGKEDVRLVLFFFSSGQFSHSVVSDSLRPHESQHARPPCPSPTPRVHSDSRPSSQWCHPASSSSVVPFSSSPQSLPASESFPMSQLFTWGG